MIYYVMIYEVIAGEYCIDIIFERYYILQLLND